jgi:hypothetical protein
MGFFSFIVLLAIAYLVWRISDQLPDLIFRLSEVQRDVAEVRRRLAEQGTPTVAPGGQPGAASGGQGTPGDVAAGAGAPESSAPTTSGPVGSETGADYTTRS